jgi:hypothetical protein
MVYPMMVTLKIKKVIEGGDAKALNFFDIGTQPKITLVAKYCKFA